VIRHVIRVVLMAVVLIPSEFERDLAESWTTSREFLRTS